MKNNTKNKVLICLVVFLSLGTWSFNKTNYFEVSKNLDIFATLFKELNTFYVDEVDPATLMKTGIDAMLKSLDPYTNYISEADIESFRLQTTGKYGGIGAIIRKMGDKIVVAELHEGFPADKAGLVAGDIILEVEGKSTDEKNTSDISKILRGSPGTDVKLKVQKPKSGAIEIVSLKRQEIQLNSVPYSGIVGENTGYIKLNSFTANCGNEVASALKKLKEDGAKSLIFDLRGNPGGLLDEAVNVSNIFIDKDMLIVSTKGKAKEWEKELKTRNPALDKDIPVVVLTSGSSASASEIVSGIMQDYDRGVVLGQKTFGKGLVQSTRQLSYNSKLKLTTAKYYIPSGRCIQKIDYSEGKNGKGKTIADSLKTAFKTKNGRVVYDAGGIEPDVSLGKEKFGLISEYLFKEGLIFDYATDYFYKNNSIGKAEDYDLSDTEYNSFVSFVKAKGLDYMSKSEKALEKLEKTAGDELLLAAIQDEINTMQNKLEQDKVNDFEKFKTDIKVHLEQEIVKRYHYQKGSIVATLDEDPEIKEAVALLKNTSRYKTILGK